MDVDKVSKSLYGAFSDFLNRGSPLHQVFKVFLTQSELVWKQVLLPKPERVRHLSRFAFQLQ